MKILGSGRGQRQMTKFLRRAEQRRARHLLAEHAARRADATLRGEARVEALDRRRRDIRTERRIDERLVADC